MEFITHNVANVINRVGGCGWKCLIISKREIVWSSPPYGECRLKNHFREATKMSSTVWMAVNKSEKNIKITIDK